MKIYIKARPNSKVEKIEKISDNIFNIWVREPAVDNKANYAIEKAIAEYFNAHAKIISGHNSKTKVIEIYK